MLKNSTLYLKINSGRALHLLVFMAQDMKILMNIEKDFLENGPWSKSSIDLVVPFYNEEANLNLTYQSNKRLERLFSIKNYIYINNGSSDNTGHKLRELAEGDPKVKVVHVAINKGYGYGMKQGFKSSTAEFILTNHADMQFDSYSFFINHLTRLKSLKSPVTLFPFRANRPLLDHIFSAGLRFWISILMLRRIRDFNGQPKLVPGHLDLSLIDSFPDDFAFDLALYLQFLESRTLSLPVTQRERHSGTSSWNIHPFARVKQIKRWVETGLRLSYFGKFLARLAFRKNDTEKP